MRYPDLPIEQLARRLDTRFQFGFAAEARNLVPEAEDFVLAPSPRGLPVLGRNEQCLAMPAEVLREVYGERVALSPLSHYALVTRGPGGGQAA